MRLRGARLAAAALAAAALAPWRGLADPQAGAENGLLAAERRLSDLEALARADEPPAARALRRLAAGEGRHALEDWPHAAILLAEALDEPALRGTPQHREALFLLADALRRQGDCAAARPRYAELVSLGASPRRREAIAGALECAVAQRRRSDVPALLREVERAFRGDPPPEVRYLAAKAIFQRVDLAPGERRRLAAAAFAAVPRPLHLQAAYFLGVLAVEQGDLAGALRSFQACARGEASSARGQDVRELCLLAVARVSAERGDVAAAVEAYGELPRASRHLPEALYELAWSLAKARQADRALGAAAAVADLPPESPMVARASLLRARLLLHLGRHDEAADAYTRVLSTYRPVRDALDALLATQEDPARAFAGLVGGRDEALDAATAPPPSLAVRWAHAERDVGAALELVGALDAARREVQGSREMAAHLEALLAQGGIDASPALRRACAGADAVANDAALLEADAVGAASAAAERALPPARRGELSRARAARLALEAGMVALPRTQEAVDDRARRLQARLDAVDAAASPVAHSIDALSAAVTGTELWFEQHRAEIRSDPGGRQRLAEELRRHRDAAAAYDQDLRALRRELTRVRDAAGGVEALAEEARLRGAYLDAVERERAAAEAARGALPQDEREGLARADAVRARAARLRARAAAVRRAFAADAPRRAAELRDRLGAEAAALASQAGALDGLEAAAKDLAGRVAYRAFVGVREQLHQLVLEADAGMVDVAWSRRRQRRVRIQQLSQEKATELEQLEGAHRAATAEGDER